MIVYIFNEEYFQKYILPAKISGVYPLFGINKQFLGNVEEINNVWNFKCAQNMFVETTSPLQLVGYDYIVLKNTINSQKYTICTNPTYDSNMQEYSINKDKITIGTNQQNDIFYRKEGLPEGNITLNYVNGCWNLETNLPNVFVMDERCKNATLFNGDYIFYHGLRVIFFGKKAIINNPNNLVGYYRESLTPIQSAEQEPIKVYQSNVMSDTPLYSKDDYFFKSPRFDSVIEEATVVIDEPPEMTRQDGTSYFLTIGPQLTMICTSGISIATTINSFSNGRGSQDTLSLGLSIATIAVTLIGAFTWPAISRLINKKRLARREEKRQNKYIDYLNKKNQEINIIKQKQRQVIIENATTLEKCQLAADNRTRVLWQRNIDHDDFLHVRLGTGSVATKININVPEERFSLEETDILFQRLKDMVNVSLNIDDVPLSVSLAEQYLIGIVGKDELIKQFLDNIFFQLMTLHSYTELKIIVFTENSKKWDYLKILPHCWDNQKKIRYFAGNTEEFNIISTELEKIFDNRKTESKNDKTQLDEEKKHDTYKAYKPYYLIFTDDINQIRNVSLIRKILENNCNIGFSLMMTNDRLSTFPSETSSFIILDEKTSGLITNEVSKNNQKQFVADYINNVDVYSYAQKIANIPINIEKGNYELPNSISFLEMYNVGKVEQLNCLERWTNNNPVNSLSVPVGIDQNGELFKMDIHEKQHGPHGLIAGTTGSGKSEWIITYILSLAVNFHPDEVQFVLIDYKGGGLAMSFENQELGIKLPHLAGTITNLDKSEINRSIESMESELKRRQAVFNMAREKLKEGSMNIYKYQQFYRKGLVKEPMSHLLIICDEFAELKQQQPEFMEQLISISRIGRSLGVHLILATQKPSGVVNDQIWSNSKFKVCLKVQDKSDSNEILKKPDAAYLRQTGAFYLEIGNDEYYNLGQSAWAGAKYYPSEVLEKKIDQSIQYIDNIGNVINFIEDSADKTMIQESKGEELLNIIQYIDTISKKETIIGRQLWLPIIKSGILISDLVKKYGHTIKSYNYNIPVGEYDEPRKQKQGLLEIDLAKGNVAIIGQAGSGKENLISTTIWSSIIEHKPNEINYYIIDMGAETLRRFSKFPHVGEVICQNEPDKIIDLFQMIIDTQEERKKLLVDYSGSFEYYNKVSEQKLPLITVIINGIDVFEELLPKYMEVLDSLYRDGPRYGIVYIVSTSTQNSLRQRQLQHFYNIIVMQLQDDTMYRVITNCRRGLIPGRKIGRGICKIDADVDSYCEFQTAIITTEDKLPDYLSQTADKMLNYYKYKAKQLLTIPNNVTSEQLKNYITDLSSVPIGYNFYEKTIAKFDFTKEKIYLITGKEVTEKTKFINGLISVLSKVPNTKIRVVDMLEIITEPLLDIKLFQDNLDVVIAAIEKDVLTRTEMQDQAINIVIGAPQYKKILGDQGIEIFQNVFDKLPQSKKITFILIDDYDKAKMLKLENWYSQFNNNNGIWVGQGLATQSIFSTNDINATDKKHNYDGLAFTITDAKYTVVKTVMDGED